MKKQYKVWIEVEEYNPKTETYDRSGEPLDLECKNEKAAIKLQCTLHEIGGAIQRHESGAPIP
jgi:hypothetical protein